MTNSKIGSFSETYRLWLNKWAPLLWSLVSFQVPATDEMLEEFVEALRGTYYNMRIRGAKRDENSIASAFIRTWGKLSSKNSFEGPWTWEEKLIVLGLFRFSWTIEQISFFLKKNPSHVTMKTYDILCQLADRRLEEGKHLGRDCVSFDLNVVDCLLQREWKDPLAYFTKDDLLKHEAECPRCKKLGIDLVNQVLTVREMPLEQLAPEVLENFNLEHDSTSGWLARNWLSQWPWFFKLPLQLGLASLVVFLVLAIPYAGDLIPNLGGPALNKNAQSTSDDSLFSPRVDPAPLPVLASLASPTPIPSPSSAMASVKAIPSPAAKTTDVAKVAVEAEVSKAKQEKLLYSWFANVLDAEESSAKVLAILSKYGAKKAGELALGAPNRGGRYFHFSLPKENLSKVVDEVKALDLKNFKITETVSGRKTPLDLRRVVFILSPIKKSVETKKNSESTSTDESLSAKSLKDMPTPSSTPEDEVPPSDPGSP